MLGIDLIWNRQHTELMSVLRRTPSGLLVTLLLLTALSPLATVQAQPAEASEYYYGVEYDWSSLDNDLENVTGLDISALFSEIMDDATDAGFNLDLGQLTTGATNIYVHQTEDISPQTVQNLNGEDVEVWSRTSDVVLRHGVLSNFVLLTDWSETTFGNEPTSFDIDVVAEAENVLTVDILYTEYLNDAYELVGADMDVAMTVGNDMNLGIDIALEGGGEELNVDFDTGINFEYSISSDAVWRMGTYSPIYVEAADNSYTSWECVDDEMDAGVQEEWGESYVYDMCGTMDGDYTGSADYEIYLTGLPTEEFGLDAGEFDISISDAFQNAGSYEEAAEMGWVVFSMGEETLQVDLGDGETINAVACDSCPPGNPVMFSMLGNVLAYSSEAFGEAVAEDFEAEIEDSLGSFIEEWLGSDDDDDDDWGDDGYWMCDNGEMIPDYYVNDGGEDCSDGSDEMDFYLLPTTASDDNDNEVYAFYGFVDTSVLGMEESEDVYFECDNGEMIPWDWINDDYEDCYDGTDEAQYDETTGEELSTYLCDDGGEIPFSYVNDGEVDCTDGSDEVESSEMDDAFYTCDSWNTAIPWQWVNDGEADCDDGSDEYDATNPTDYYCEDGGSTSFENVSNGVEDCADGSDEGSAFYMTMDIWMYDDENNMVMDASDLMMCGHYLCDSYYSPGDSVYVSTGVQMTSPSAYGSTEQCVTAELYDMDGILLTDTDFCDSTWSGPEIWTYQTYVSDQGDMSVGLHAGAGSWDESYNDVTMAYELVDEMDNVIDSGSMAFNDDYDMYLEEYVDVPSEGEYCMTVTLTEDGATEPFDAYEACETVEEGIEPSDRLATIAEAFADSSLENVLTAFGENLEETFNDVAENEAPEFPYVDGMWAPLWSTEHATIVGVGVYAWDDNENGYVIAGPETTGYSDDLPMVFASITYVTGVPAQEAQTAMADLDSLEDIVDIENHDLSTLEEALEEAGADTSDLGITEEGGNDGGEDGTPSAEDIAEDAGLLPFMSPLALVAMIGLAVMAAQARREEDE